MSLRVLRNAPEVCVIRLGCTVAYGYDWGRTYLDLRLRRGDRNVEGTLVSAAQSDWGVAFSGVTACTARTGGIRVTANDADGNRYVLAQADAITSDLVNGSIRQTAATYNVYPFMVSSEIGGSGVAASSLDVAQNLIYTYMAATGERAAVRNWPELVAPGPRPAVAGSTRAKENRNRPTIRRRWIPLKPPITAAAVHRLRRSRNRQ